MKILQINLSRNVAVHDLIEATAVELNSDIVIAIEPSKKIIKKNRELWLKDNKIDVAIKIRNTNIGIGEQGTGKGFVWAKLGQCIVMSVYISSIV